MKKLLLISAALLISTPALAGPSLDDLTDDIKADYDARLDDMFKDFHRTPELSMKETKTAAKMAKLIKAEGFKVTTGVGGTGLVAVMKNGKGPTVLLRADMDGLPVKENSGLSYASKAMGESVDGQTKPTMHACGHDVHITSLIATAKQLAARKDEWSGTLVLIGQPGEERLLGARAMIEDGLYERFPKPDYALAFHVSAQTPAGRLVVPTGLAYSSSDMVDITVHGIGAHGASPHMGLDPVLVASAITVNLQSIVARTISPLEAGVITVGSIHGGTKHNIIPDKVEMQLTVRSDDPDVRKKLLDSIDRVARGTAIAYGTPKDKLPTVKRLPENTGPTKNHTETAEFLRGVFADGMGDDIIYDQPRKGMGAEDFAYFIAPETGVKGVYFNVGGTPEKDLDTAASHHSPFFKVEPESSIRLGTEAMVRGAIGLFEKG